MSDEQFRKGFVGGLTTGLGAALSIVENGGGAEGIRTQLRKMKEVEAREHGRGNGREMMATDFCEPVAVAHPQDFGFPFSADADALARASRIRVSGQAAPLTPPRISGANHD